MLANFLPEICGMFKDPKHAASYVFAANTMQRSSKCPTVDAVVIEVPSEADEAVLMTVDCYRRQLAAS